MQEHKYEAAVQSEGMRALLNLTTTVPENALKATSVGAIEATVRIHLKKSTQGHESDAGHTSLRKHRFRLLYCFRSKP